MSLRGLHAQLLLWTILPLIASLVIGAVAGVNAHQQSMRAMVAERNGALARVAAAQWSEMLADRARDLQTVAPSPQSFDGGILLLDADGRTVRAEPSVEAWAARAAIVSALLKDQRPAYSRPFLEAQTLRMLVAVNAGQGIAVGSFQPPSLQRLGFGARGVAYLVDARGRVLYHPDTARVDADLSDHAGIRDVMRGEQGAAFHHDAAATELVVGFAPIAPTGWGLIIEEPWEDVVVPMLRYSLVLPLIILLASVIALLAVFFGVRAIVRPLQLLDDRARRLAWGDFGAVRQPVGGVREIENLRQTLERMAEQIQRYQTSLRDYIGAMTRGQEDERRRLARELHDDTTQSLIALAQRIEMTQKALARDPVQVGARLDELKTMNASAIENVRRFTRDLRPLYLEDLGLETALETLVGEAEARAGLSAAFHVAGEPRRLPADLELVLFRIAQEALNNVTQHAHARHVTVRLAFHAGAVELAVEDDGIGFSAPDSPNNLARDGHFGLMGMQERALMVGGHLTLQSAPQQGTHIAVTVPVV